MALTKDLTKTIEIPHEAGQSITIRKLSHRQLGDARAEKVRSSVRLVSEMGNVRDMLPQGDPGSVTTTPADELDRATVLRAAITGWSYGAACTPENIDELDEETAAWAFGEILAFSLRTAPEGNG